MSDDVPLVSRYAALRPWPARLVLVGAALMAVGLVLTSLGKIQKGGETYQKYSDLELYRRVVADVHQGRNYYDALMARFAELEAPPSSFFHFRTPTFAWVFGSLPDPVWVRFLLGVLVALTLVLTYFGLRPEVGPGRAAIGAALLLSGFVWGGMANVEYVQELWAAVLIALSIAAYGVNCRSLGVFAGLAALFFRELSLPYCGLSLLLAVRRRGWAEAAAWVGGLALYGLFLAWHFQQIQRLLPPGGGSHVLDWVQIGGVRFLISTCQMSYALVLYAPAWVSALYLLLAALGLGGSRGVIAERALGTVVLFLVAFFFVGQPKNVYWGLMYVSFLSLGLLWLPASLRDLWRAASTSKKC